jgi:uncharacterized glyoxalase superfamily protein PhnB
MIGAMMKPTPPGWSRISSAVYYDDPLAAVDWLCKAFGFVIQQKIIEGGKLAHSELKYAEGLIMVGDAKRVSRGEPSYRSSPRSVGGANTQNMMLYVDDVEAHYQQARAAGATMITEPATTDYGPDYWSDRGYEAEDLEGHHWWFIQRIRNPPAKSSAY